FWSKQNKLFRILIAYSSLIFAAAMFGFIVGVADMMFGVPGRIPWAVAMQGISICVGGILILNFYLIGIIFWPLSYIGFMILNASLLKTERY
ncbi:MAG: hypothetical protein KDD62_16485, partial [Bdellovibrionales bacterium]|nr:hypothetical protein [Bdellovibrionales bacterium]